MLEGEECCVLVNLQHVLVSDILTPKDNRLEMDDHAYEYDYRIRRLTIGTAALKLENSLQRSKWSFQPKCVLLSR